MEKTSPIRVLIADDHPFMRLGLAMMLEQEPGMTVIAQASDGVAAVEGFETSRPDICILDLRMPKLNGILALKAIRKIDPEARVIMLSTAIGEIHIGRAYSAGASAFLFKDAIREELAETVRTLAAGGKRASEFVAQQSSRYDQVEGLSPREIEVLQHAAKGLSNKRIGDALGLTENTVKGYLANVLQKLDAQDRTHAVTLALSHGYFDLDRHHN